MTLTYHPDEPNPKLIAQLALEFVANIGKMGVHEREAISAILSRSANPLVIAEPTRLHKGENRVAKVIQVGAMGEKQLEIVDVVTTPHGLQVKVL